MNILQKLLNKITANPERSMDQDSEIFRDATVALVSASSWNEVEQVVKTNRVLLSSAAETYFRWLIVFSLNRYRGLFHPAILDAYQELLKICRQKGIRKGIDEVQSLQASHSRWLDEAMKNPFWKGFIALENVDEENVVDYLRIVRDYPIMHEEPTQERIEHMIMAAALAEENDWAENTKKRLFGLRSAIQLLRNSPVKLIDSSADPLNDPLDWAMTLRMMAGGAVSLHNEERLVELEGGLMTLEAALEVYSQEYHQKDWADTHLELATTYLEIYRYQMEETDLLENARFHFQQALEVFTQASYPEKWAKIYHGLGLTYYYDPREKNERKEEAIKYARLALDALEAGDFAEERARIQSDMSIFFRSRRKGDRIENQEQALYYAQQALRIYTKEDHPENWSMTHSNLGNIYSTRVKGEASENYKKALDHYQQALQVRTQEGSPLQWATTHYNLGNLLFYDLNGDEKTEAEILEQKMLAYDHFQQATKIFTRETYPWYWGISQLNMAVILPEIGEGNSEDVLKQSMKLIGQSLKVLTRDDFPDYWAATQQNLGILLLTNQQTPDLNADLEQAISNLRQALEVFSPKQFPEDTRKTATLLGKFLAQRKRWDEAKPVLAAAMNAEEILFQQSLFRANKEAEISEADDLFWLAAYVNAQAGDLKSAVVALEQGRARLLGEVLEKTRADQLRGMGYEQEWDDFNYLLVYQRMHNAQIDAALKAWAGQDELEFNEKKENLEFQRVSGLDQIASELDKAIVAIRKIPEFENFFRPLAFDEISAVTKSVGPLVYLLAGAKDGLALIVHSDSVQLLWLDNLTSDDVLSRFQTYVGAYDARNHSRIAWFDALDNLTRWLWDAVMGPILDALAQKPGADGDEKRAILIPAGILGLLPLHAAWTDDGENGRRYAQDEIIFTYAPSARAIIAARGIASQTIPDTLLAVDEPQPVSADPLPNSKNEITAVTQQFSSSRVLRGEEATVSAVLEAVSEANVYHFACHGYANFRTPLNSGLVMANDYVLALEQLVSKSAGKEKWNPARLAVLSACETGIAADIERPDEVVSLSSGMLQSGVAGVVSSLWSVDDRSTMILMVRFYDNWLNGQMDPAQALRNAQQWLRETSEDEIMAYIDSSVHAGLDPDDKSSVLRTMGYQGLDGDVSETGYAHPFYWAAFTFTGV